MLENLSSPAGFKFYVLEAISIVYFLHFVKGSGHLKCQKLEKILKFVILKILDPALQSFKEVIKYLF